MRWLGALVRPSGFGGWLLYVCALGFAGLMLAFTLIGETSLQRLAANGTQEVVPVARVLERDSGGTPTRVLVDRSWDGKEHELEDLAGSLVGTDRVRVRTYPGDQTMMSATAFAHASVGRQTAGLVLGPLLLAGLVVAATNSRRAFRRETPSVWATQSNAEKAP